MARKVVNKVIQPMPGPSEDEFKMTHREFPDDLDHPNKKADYRWGRQVAQAIFYNNDRNGPNLFFRARDDHKKYLDYALGEQSEQMYKPIVGINPATAEKSWVGSIRWQIKNYATKRINIAVEKMRKMEFEPIVDAIDPTAQREKKRLEARLKAYKAEEEFFKQMGDILGTNFAPEGMSPDEIPQDAQEAETFVAMEHKLKACSMLEEGIRGELLQNDWEDLNGLCDFDSFVIGVRTPYCGVDENGKIELDRMNPSRLILPYSERPDFKRQKYWGYIDRWDMARVVKRFHKDPMWSKELYRRIRDEFASKTWNYQAYDHYNDLDPRDIDRVDIMRFEYRTTNDLVYVQKPDGGGNMRYKRQDYNYYKTAGQQKKFKSRYRGQRKLVRQRVNTIYEGFWVVGSDIVLGWREKKNQERQRGDLAESLFGLKIYAPNMYDGKLISTAKQMIPILDDLQSYNLQIQKMLAQPMPYGVGIDLDALRRANLKWDGKQMTDQQKIEMFMQSKIFVFSSESKLNPGAAFKPFIEGQYGIKIQEYLELIQQALFELDEIIGINKLTAGSEVQPKQGARVSMMQQQATDNALGYLYRARQRTSREIYRSISVHYINKLYYSKDPVERQKGAYLRKYIYNVDVEPKPTQESWERIYQWAAECVKLGLLDPTDMLLFEQIDNLKRLSQIIKYKVRRNKREAMEAKQQDIQMNGQMQQASNEQTHKNSMNLEDKKGQWSMAEQQEVTRREIGKANIQLEASGNKDMADLIQTLVEGNNKIDVEEIRERVKKAQEKNKEKTPEK